MYIVVTYYNCSFTIKNQIKNNNISEKKNELSTFLKVQTYWIIK